MDLSYDESSEIDWIYKTNNPQDNNSEYDKNSIKSEESINEDIYYDTNTNIWLFEDTELEPDDIDDKKEHIQNDNLKIDLCPDATANQINSDSVECQETPSNSTSDFDQTNEINTNIQAITEMQDTQVSCSKKAPEAYMNCESFDVAQHFSSQFLYIANHLSSHNIFNTQRGKPIKRLSHEKKEQLIHNWSDKFFKQIVTTTRSDSQITSVIRNFRKVGKLMHDLYGCHSYYKDSSLIKNLDTYLVTFFEGFLTFWNYPLPEHLVADSEEEYQLMSLFKDFCILSFSQKRIKSLFQKILIHLNHKFDKTIKLIGFKWLSIQSAKNFHIKNTAFELVCLNYRKLLRNMNDEKFITIEEVVSKILPEESID